MTDSDQTGSRIRDKRIERGVRQAELAKRCGISASYLNLIEHNRRRIAGKLLQSIAEHLEVPAETLSQGVDSVRLDQLRGAAVALGQDVELDKVQEFAIRYPGWADLVVHQSDQMSAMQTQVSALNNRLTHDPTLAHSLHEVISSVTAIRSSASILVSGETLDADWQARFHQNVYQDAVRLARTSEALIRYLEAPQTTSNGAMLPKQEAEAWLEDKGHHIADLETGATSPREIVEDAELTTAQAAQALNEILVSYAADAKALRYEAFEAAAVRNAFNPLLIARDLGCDVTLAMRRLTNLKPGRGFPEVGLASCDASGAIHRLKTIAGFDLPRAGAGCPLWPMYSAFSRPDQPVRAVVELPIRDGDRFMVYALASAKGAANFDAPPVLQSTMVVLSDPPVGASDVVELGTTCAVCPRDACPARNEPSVLLRQHGL